MFVVLICLFVSSLSVASIPDHGPGADWIKEQIYTTFLANPCVTLADATGPIGCRTPRDGLSGVLYFANSTKELDDAISAGSSFDPIALMVAPQLLSLESLRKMQESNNVAGIIIADQSVGGNSKPLSFSPAEAFPNIRFGLHPDSQHKWNPGSSGMIMENVQKPWFSLGPEDTKKYLSALVAAGGNRVGVEFTLQMKTTSDSATCLRRGWCDPVGGVSVVASLASYEEIRNAGEVVAVVASMDSSSMFHTRAPGAVSDISGTVALLAAFQALGLTYGNATAKRAAVFHWFTAEAWGYSGSKWYVKDMMEGNGIYNKSQISMLIEPKQVGSKSSNGKLHIHQETNGRNDHVVSVMEASAAKVNATITVVPPLLGIPPSSSMSYLLKFPDLPTAILTDHEAAYENKFYHSLFDDYDNIDSDLVCSAASVLATTIAELQEYDQILPIKANCSFVDKLLRCFAQDWRCPLFTEYISGMSNAPEFPTSYTGVWRGTNTMTPPTKILHDIVTEINTPSSAPLPKCERNRDCGDVEKYQCIRGACVESTKTWYWKALSPAFEKATNWQIVNDSSLPAFTETIWINVGMKLFPMVSPLTDVMTLAMGVLITIVSIVICYFGGRVFKQNQ